MESLGQDPPPQSLPITERRPPDSSFPSATGDGVDRTLVDDIIKDLCLLGLPDKIKGYLTLKKLENKNMTLSVFIYLGTGIEQTITTSEGEIGAVASMSTTS